MAWCASRGVVVAVVLGGGVLGGCSSASTPEREEAAPGPVTNSAAPDETVGVSQDIRTLEEFEALPLSVVFGSDPVFSGLYSGVPQIYTAACLRAEGIDPPLDAKVTLLGRDVRYHSPIGFEDRADLAAYYESKPREGTSQHSQRMNDWVGGLSETGKQTVHEIRWGDEESPGCQAMGETALFGGEGNAASFYKTVNTLNDLRLERDAELMQSPSFATALESWKRCMKQRGFTVERPPIDGSQAAYREKLELYAADVECKAADGTLDAMKAALSEVENALIDRNPGLIERWLASRNDAVRHGREVLQQLGYNAHGEVVDQETVNAGIR